MRKGARWSSIDRCQNTRGMGCFVGVVGCSFHLDISVGNILGSLQSFVGPGPVPTVFMNCIQKNVNLALMGTKGDKKEGKESMKYCILYTEIRYILYHCDRDSVGGM